MHVWCDKAEPEITILNCSDNMSEHNNAKVFRHFYFWSDVAKFILQ